MPAMAPAALAMMRDETAVDAGNVDDRGHHRHVGDADIGADVAGGERRQHQFRDADRQRPHRRGADRGAAAAAHRDDAVDPPFAVEPRGDHRGAPRHRRHRLAAVVPGAEGGEVGAAGAGDLVGTNAGCEKRLAENADVDHERGDAGRLDPRLEVRELDALGVERADDRHDLRVHVPPPPESAGSVCRDRPSGKAGREQSKPTAC